MLIQHSPPLAGPEVLSLDTERLSFIKKVYLLFGASLGTAGLGAFLGRDLAPEGFWLRLSIALALLFLTMACRKIRPLNLVLLFTFTFVDGFLAGPILGVVTRAGHGDLIVQALGFTTLAMGLASAYVLVTGARFSVWRGTLMVSLSVLVVMHIYHHVVGTSGLMPLWMVLAGIVLFVGFVLHDTSRLMHDFPTDEYVEATIELYLDFMNLFWDFLQLLLHLGAAAADSA